MKASSATSATAIRAVTTPAVLRRPAGRRLRRGAEATPGAGAGVACSLTEIGPPHVRVLEQARRRVGERDRSAFHHVTAVAGLERELRVLFHQQQCHSFLGDGAYRIEYLLHH